MLKKFNRETVKSIYIVSVFQDESNPQKFFVAFKKMIAYFFGCTGYFFRETTENVASSFIMSMSTPNYQTKNTCTAIYITLRSC